MHQHPDFPSLTDAATESARRGQLTVLYRAMDADGDDRLMLDEVVGFLLAAADFHLANALNDADRKFNRLPGEGGRGVAVEHAFANLPFPSQRRSGGMAPRSRTWAGSMRTKRRWTRT